MSGERTEAATPKRKATLRGQGSIARSPELASAIGLLVALLVLQNWAGSAATNIQGLLVGTYGDLGSRGRAETVDTAWATHAIGQLGQAWLWSVLPLMIGVPAIAVCLQLAQTRGLVSFHGLMRFSSLNPMTGVQRIFSLQSLVALGRSLFKLLIVGGFTWRGLQDAASQIPQIDGSTDPHAMLVFIGQTIVGIGMPAAEAMLGVGIADYAYQRWAFERRARMTKQDVKDEYKQAEGDPHIKGKIRGRQMQMARRRRQLENVPNATVVVTNPTHIAVALQYEASMSSPKVVAIGADLVAQKIKEVARQAGVPCVENVPLARGLYRAVDVGDEIPVELYSAVAEVLAYVFNLKRRRRERARQQQPARSVARY